LAKPVAMTPRLEIMAYGDPMAASMVFLVCYVFSKERKKLKLVAGCFTE
jgi:hypothetical protein